jgi:hypothetical protein
MCQHVIEYYRHLADCFYRFGLVNEENWALDMIRRYQCDEWTIFV